VNRTLVGATLVYGLLMAFCALWAGHLSAETQAALRPYFWLMGPPANLVHGTNYLLPFFIGTALVAGFVFGIERSTSAAARGLWGTALAIAWCAFGFIAYAPSA
jgi:hypothetical protein